ncbi:S-adenosyl-L-methionine-dependent methyltransferase [Chytriomyces sp. MP71]|nr:S-adenosyl-L-methionine-dependent methyltransferase [Chytriomyces sp. MP71]
MEKGASFPAKFTQFLLANGVRLEDYAAETSLPRFFRINPRRVLTREDEAAIAVQVSSEARRVAWLPAHLAFFSAPASSKLSGTNVFEDGSLFGIDVASAVAVHALSLQPNDHVLDLCCAPGAKMALIHDLQGHEPDTHGSVTGVDVSKARIATCKSVLRKYKMSRFRLFDADGALFNVHAPSRVGKWTRDTAISSDNHVRHLEDTTAKPAAPDGSDSQDDATHAHVNFKRKPDCDSTQRELPEPAAPATPRKTDKVKPFLATKMLLHDPQLVSPALLYDRVLVDAECTHDGSIAHLKKCDDMGWDKFEAYFFDKERMDGLETLQRNLLSNGFRLLKPGGILVYSTCSFLRRQNEDIVNWFINQSEGSALLEAVPDADVFPVAPPLDEESRLMLRFSPSASGTSGLFIARIRKVE